MLTGNGVAPMQIEPTRGAGPGTRPSFHETVSTRAWLSLGLGVLGLAGVMALLVALSRTPAIKTFLPPSYFRVALIAHVDLLLVVWYLVMPVLLWRQLGLLGGRWERVAFNVMAVGVAGVVVPSVVGLGEPVLAHYIPFLVQPVFLAGLAVFMAGVGVAAIQAASRFGTAPSPLARAGAAAAACVLGALLSMAIMTVRVAGVETMDGIQKITLITWVGGHPLQWANVANMLVTLGLLLSGGKTLGRVAERLSRLVQIYLVGVVAAVLGALALSLDTLQGSLFLTKLSGLSLGLPTAVGVVLTLLLWRRTRGDDIQARIGRATTLAALLLLVAGGVIALSSDLRIQTTLVPAHYHGVLSAVAVAFMGFTYHIIVREGIRLPSARWAVLQPYAYSLGTLLLLTGMAWAGANGAPRKTPGAAFAEGDTVTLLALNLWGLGAILAVVGGAAYLFNAGRALLRWVGEKSDEQT